MHVLSIKDNSVRIRTGIVTFDVLVLVQNNKPIMKTPKNIYISNRSDFEKLAKIVISAYLNTIKESNTNETNTREDSIS